MAMSEIKVECARPEDREAIVELATTAFRTDNPTHPNFEELFPHFYHESIFSAENHLVVRHNGRIVANVAVRPIRFAAGPNSISTAGVGDVSTHPDSRGNGYMTTLMAAAENLIEERGYVLAYLNGDRFRYSRFGWEAVGCVWSFSFNEKCVTDVELTEWEIVESDGGPPWMHSAIKEKAYRRIMDIDEMTWSLKRSGRRVVSAEGSSGLGVIVYDTRDQREFGAAGRSIAIKEWGGEPEAILALITSLVTKEDVETVSVTTPCVSDELTGLLRSRASRCGAAAPYNLRIGRLDELLQAYLPWLSRAAHLCPEGIAFNIRDSGQSVTLYLGGDPSVAVGPAAHEVSLNRLEMTMLLFGPTPPSRAFSFPPKLAILDTIFPLPVFISGLSDV